MSPVITYLVSGVYLLDSSDLSHCAFIGHYDIRTAAVIHQCYARRKKRKEASHERLQKIFGNERIVIKALAALWCWDCTPIEKMLNSEREGKEVHWGGDWGLKSMHVRRQTEERRRNMLINIISNLISRAKNPDEWDKLLNDGDVSTRTTYSGKTADPRWESSSSSMVKPLQLTWRHEEKKTWGRRRDGASQKEGKTQTNRWRQRPAWGVIWYYSWYRPPLTLCVYIFWICRWGGRVISRFTCAKSSVRACSSGRSLMCLE